MKSSQISNEAITVGCYTAVIGAIVYPLMITTHGYRWYNYLLEMSFGPLMIISHVGLYHFIKTKGDSIFNLLALIFYILSGLAVLMTNCIQKSVFSFQRSLGPEIFEMGNLVQLGMDYLFDVLVSVATVLISLALLRQTYFSKWIALLGIVIGVGGLCLNTIGFPVPPADDGLFDPGPFYAIFIMILFFTMIFEQLKKSRS